MRYVPASYSVKVEDGDAVVYINRERLCALGFAGKSAKPSFNYLFRSVEALDLHVANFFESRRKSVEFKKTLRAEAKARKESLLAGLKVGDILVGSWGYDQTNVNFYEVISKSGSTLIMRELNQDVRQTGFMSGQTMPLKNSYCGEPIKRVVRSGGVKITESISVSPWDGREQYVSWYA